MPVVVKVQVAFSVLDSTASVRCTVMSLVGLDFRRGFGFDCGRFVPDDVAGFDTRFASSVFSDSRLVWANVGPVLHLGLSDQCSRMSGFSRKGQRTYNLSSAVGTVSADVASPSSH